LRAAVSLASAPNSVRTTRQLAELTQVPAGYLSKVMQMLVDGGIVTSQRGLGGGFALARAPAGLTLLEVVNAVEPLQRIRSCPLRLTSHAVRLCSLHQRLDDALATVEKAFAETTIAELLADSRDERPLCPAPPTASSPLKNGDLAVTRGAVPTARPRLRRGRAPKSR
jgi:Rrf2 family nitric oxide-sensitive transcriptional repressor